MRKCGNRCVLHRWRLTPVLLVALAVLLLASCAGVGRDPGEQDDIEMAEETATEPTQGSTVLRDSMTLEELTRRPGRLYRERVSVTGVVGRELTSDTFSLTSDEAASSEVTEGEAFEAAAALVIGEGSLPNLSEGQRVRVTGEVRRFDIQELERELDTNLQDSLYAGFEENPVILPGTVELLAGGETTER